MRLHGLILRLPGRLVYPVTDIGLRTALFYTLAYDRVIAPGFADCDGAVTAAPTELRLAMTRVEHAWHRHTKSLVPHAA